MLNEQLIKDISRSKNEPKWMLKLRLDALRIFNEKKLPNWQIPNLNSIDFDSINYYNPNDVRANKWNDVPEKIKKIYDKIGVPDAEKKFLAGSVAQYQSDSIYKNIKKEWQKKGVIFMGLDEAVQKHPSLVRKYFTKSVPISDNKFSALHYAVWSGGSFLYVPKGVKITMPMQTYFFMSGIKEGQFEHTLIVAEKNSDVHYIEGCTAIKYDKNSLHSAVVEIFVKDNAKMRYTTVQNWSKNVYNLNTKRAIVNKNALMEWVGGSLGAKVSMLYPCSVLKGEGARANHLTITLASNNTIKEGGAKVIHLAKNTHSNIISKGINIGNGYGVYRGLVKIIKGAKGSTSNVRCDSLMIGNAQSDTFPYVNVNETENVSFSHEATTGKISKELLDYVMSKGISKNDATMLFISGFIKPVLNEIPLEYAAELNKYLRLEIDETLG